MADYGIQEVTYSNATITAFDATLLKVALSDSHVDAFTSIKAQLQTLFSSAAGLHEIVRINYTDGIRIMFANGDVAHIRPSGNADELRMRRSARMRLRYRGLRSRMGC
ncbi:hypothetical protein BDW69DRAFT_108886 [Aspergillus filifer]